MGEPQFNVDLLPPNPQSPYRTGESPSPSRQTYSRQQESVTTRASLGRGALSFILIENGAGSSEQ